MVNLPQIPQQVHSFIGYILHSILLFIHWLSKLKTSTALKGKQHWISDDDRNTTKTSLNTIMF